MYNVGDIYECIDFDSSTYGEIYKIYKIYKIDKVVVNSEFYEGRTEIRCKGVFIKKKLPHYEYVTWDEMFEQSFIPYPNNKIRIYN
jgi:hypothetical protein